MQHISRTQLALWARQGAHKRLARPGTLDGWTTTQKAIAIYLAVIHDHHRVVSLMYDPTCDYPRIVAAQFAEPTELTGPDGNMLIDICDMAIERPLPLYEIAIRFGSLKTLELLIELNNYTRPIGDLDDMTSEKYFCDNTLDVMKIVVPYESNTFGTRDWTSWIVECFTDVFPLDDIVVIEDDDIEEFLNKVRCFKRMIEFMIHYPFNVAGLMQLIDGHSAIRDRHEIKTELGGTVQLLQQTQHKNQEYAKSKAHKVTEIIRNLNDIHRMHGMPGFQIEQSIDPKCLTELSVETVRVLSSMIIDPIHRSISELYDSPGMPGSAIPWKEIQMMSFKRLLGE